MQFSLLAKMIAPKEARKLAQETIELARGKVESFPAWREKAGATKGALFDYSTHGQRPPAPQKRIERYEPKHGASGRLTDALAKPGVKAGMGKAAQRGLDMGAADWYSTEPIRQYYIKQFGPEAGEALFRREMLLTAATSPGTPVPDNIKLAGYYNWMGEQGLRAPRVPDRGYGGKTAATRGQGVNALIDEQKLPDTWRKANSFGQNLLGNWQPVAVDTHNFRLLGMLSEDPRFIGNSVDEPLIGKGRGPMGRDRAIDELSARYMRMPESAAADLVDREIGNLVSKGKDPLVSRVRLPARDMTEKGWLTEEEAMARPGLWDAVPRDNEYGAYEKVQQGMAKRRGLDPAQFQAGMWFGGGEKTGLMSPYEPFAVTKEARTLYQADKLGQDPEYIARLLAAGKIPGLKKGGRVNPPGLAARAPVPQSPHMEDPFNFLSLAKGTLDDSNDAIEYQMRLAEAKAHDEAHTKWLNRTNEVYDNPLTKALLAVPGLGRPVGAIAEAIIDYSPSVMSAKTREAQALKRWKDYQNAAGAAANPWGW